MQHPPFDGAMVAAIFPIFLISVSHHDICMNKSHIYVVFNCVFSSVRYNIFYNNNDDMASVGVRIIHTVTPYEAQYGTRLIMNIEINFHRNV